MDGGQSDVRALRLVDGTLGHIEAIVPFMRSDEVEQYLAVTGDKFFDPADACFLFARIGGPRWTITDGRGDLLVTGGIETLRQGVGRAWMAGPLAAWQKHGMGITRLCRRLFNAAIEGEHYDRIEILALPSRTAAHDWYKRGLGFELEGIRKRYQNGHDFVAYTKTRP
ncbi:MAG: hypothetical protein C0437_07880 [Ralstonia sp.]|nr:hypothetical protein [Ralstonia sp.]MBA4279295.1 hypothetical protein [Ralstonia sp.]